MLPALVAVEHVFRSNTLVPPLLACSLWQVAGVQVYVADRFGGWHAKVLACLAGMYDEASNSFPADAMQQV